MNQPKLVTFHVLYALAVRHSWWVGKQVTHKRKKYIIRDLCDHHDSRGVTWVNVKAEPV